jgi:hypothetical protein
MGSERIRSRPGAMDQCACLEPVCDRRKVCRWEGGLLTHRRVFRHVVGHRDSLAWWNFAFLATITVMPFTSSLLGEYPSNPLAVTSVPPRGNGSHEDAAGPGNRSSTARYVNRFVNRTR